MSDTIIKFDNVSFAYELEDEGIVNAVNDFSLEVPEGQFLAVLGHNGCGKSTVAKLINGILVPNKGKVTVEGMDTSDEEKTVDIRKTVGMVFQNPDNQIVATIVEDDVAFGPENIGMPREEIGRAIDFALKVTDMEKFRHSEAAKLSGGQKQRVAIAGAIAIYPEILILDESTSMLDPKGRREVMEVVKTLNKERGMTVIDITHYMDEAVKADRVIVMDGGRIAMDGTPKEVFRNVERMKKLGLDVPQATELAYRLRKKGFKLPEDILDENECAEAILKVLEVRK